VLRYRVDLVDPVTGRSIRQKPRQTLGRTLELRTRQAARAAADAFMSQVTGRKVQAGRAVSAAAYVDRYLAERVPLMRPATRVTRETILRRHLRPALSGKRLDQVTVAEVQRLVGRLAAAGHAPAYVRAIVAALRTLLRAARAEGLPCEPFETRQLQFPSRVSAQETPHAFSEAELRALLAGTVPPWRVAYAIAGTLGLRAGETLGLRWEDLDLARATVTLRQAAVRGQVQGLKSRTSRATLPLAAGLVEILQAYRETVPATGLLFRTAEGRPLHANRYREQLTKDLKRLGLPHLTPHAFRHGLATQLLAKGLGAAAVRDALRHGSLGMTDRYSHALSDDLRRAATLINPFESEKTP
jgi:integrase